MGKRRKREMHFDAGSNLEGRRMVLCGMPIGDSIPEATGHPFVPWAYTTVEPGEVTCELCQKRLRDGEGQ